MNALEQIDLHGLSESLERGATLPGSWFTDPAIFELEQERIFGQFWQYAGLTSQIPKPGDFLVVRSGRLPIVVVRDEAGGINAFFNVCPHRGAEVVKESCGHRMTLQCQYHAWTFGLDGALRRAPRAENNAQFSSDGLALRPVGVDRLGPLVFVNPDVNAAPLESVFGRWYDTVRASGFDFESVLNPPETHVFEFQSNWKVQIQNSLECYHCPTNHPGLSKVSHVDEDFWFEHEAWYQRYGGRTRDSAVKKTGEDGFYHIEPGPEQHSYLSYLFPNFFFTVQRGHRFASASICLPVAVDRCVYVRHYCFADDVPDNVRRDAIAFTNEVQYEDIELCGSVQRGLAAGVYDQGRLLLPSTEPGVSHHERQVFRALTGLE